MTLSPQHDQTRNAALHQQKSQAAADDLVSVTVRKTDPNQKAGVKVVQKQDGIYITAITEDGLLDNAGIEVGDKLLSINGKRLRRGENTGDFMKLIAFSRDKVAMVVKKASSKKVNSHSPKKKRPVQKLVQKEAFRKPDGSFDYEVSPILKSYLKAVAGNLDDKEQTRIPAKKLFAEQGCGLTFKKKGDMLFVNGISLDSIFKDTQLEFGDRVVCVNDVNFMTYADAKYATTLLKRAKGDVDIIVEKGWEKLDMKTDVDRHHDEPSRDSESTDGNTHGKRKHGDVVIKMLDQLDMERKAIKERHADRLNKSFESTYSNVQERSLDKKDRASTMGKPDSFNRISQGSFSNGLHFQQYNGDYLCVSIRKNSETHPGVKLKKREGKFFLHKLPEHEKRIPVGVQIFAINGRSCVVVDTVIKAKEMINATKEEVVLFINFDDLVAVRASDLMQLIGPVS
jgi:C-terminal processing protease CtpA/Prc